MSCNGCRVLRKGCGEACALRPCLQWIESPEAQGHATLFVAKFFGRAGLVSFISAVPEPDRPALFQSLLFEACGRAVNPVNGAVGLLWTGNWHLCQAAVETVLRGGTLRPLPPNEGPQHDVWGQLPKPQHQQPPPPNRRKLALTSEDDEGGVTGLKPVEPPELELCLTASARPRRRPGTPSEESVTTSADSGVPTATTSWQQQQEQQEQQQQPRLLNLFV